MKRSNNLRSRVEAFSANDIRIGTGVLTVECDVQIGQQKHSYLVHKPRESSTTQEKKAGMPREQVLKTPEKAMFMGEPPEFASDTEPGGRPLAMLFSTRRAEPSERDPGSAVAGGDIAGAFGDAFANRELRIGEFGAWLTVQDSMRRERPAAGRKLAACEEAVRRFLPDYANLRLGGEDHPHLWINRSSTPIPVRQLSDGERGVLAIVLDLTRRLAQANPNLTNPASEAEAVVLIDEIDLHLHPKWQRQIVHNLTATFPRCQFIATTHSPQVIGEVPHERIQIITDGEVYSPTHSFGVDSSRVLEEIMDADPRAKKVKELLSDVSQSIGNEQFDQAPELNRRTCRSTRGRGPRGDAAANPPRFYGGRMRTIVKQQEPASLTQHRLTPPRDGYIPDYDNFPDKDTLRDGLVREQRGLCCYCMRAISNNPREMKVEHWKCQSRFPEQQLDHRNILAACRGGEGMPKDLQHCDTRKGDKDLKWNPANSRHRIEARLRYAADGRVESGSDEFNSQLEEVLNLNLPLLMTHRKRILDAILDWSKHEQARRQGPIPRARLERERDRRIPLTGTLTPYCQVAVWWLNQRLKRMAA